MSGSLDYVKNTLSGILDGSMSIVRHSSDTSDNWFSYMDIYYTTSSVYLVGKINANNEVWDMSGEEYANDTVKDTNLLLTSNRPGDVSTLGNYYSKVNLKNMLLDVNAEDGTNSFGAFVHEWTDISSGVTLHITARTPANKAISHKYDSAPAPGTGVSDPVVSLKGIDRDIKVTLTLSAELISGANPVNSIYFTVGSENVKAIGSAIDGEGGAAGNDDYMTFESDLSLNEIINNGTNTEEVENITTTWTQAGNGDWTVTYQLIQDLAMMNEDISNDVWYEVSVTYSSTLGNSNATKGHVHAQDAAHNVEDLSMSYSLLGIGATDAAFNMSASWSEYSDEDYVNDTSAGVIRVFQLITGQSDILQYDFNGNLDENGTTDASWEEVSSSPYSRDTTSASWTITNASGDGKCVFVAAYFDSSDTEIETESQAEKLSRCIGQSNFTGLNTGDNERATALTFAMLNNQPVAHTQSAVVSNNIDIFEETASDEQTLSFVVTLDSSHTNGNNLDVSFSDMTIVLSAESGKTHDPSTTSSTYTEIGSDEYDVTLSGITDLSVNVSLSLTTNNNVNFALNNNLKAVTTIVYKDPLGQDLSAGVNIPSSSSGFGGDISGVRGPSNSNGNFRTDASNSMGEAAAALVTRKMDPFANNLTTNTITDLSINDTSLSDNFNEDQDFIIQLQLPGTNNSNTTTYLADSSDGDFISDISFQHHFVNGFGLTATNIGMGGHYLNDVNLVVHVDASSATNLVDGSNVIVFDNTDVSYVTDANGDASIPMRNFKLWDGKNNAHQKVIQTKATVGEVGNINYIFTYKLALASDASKTSEEIVGSSTITTTPNQLTDADMVDVFDSYKWNDLVADVNGNTDAVGDADLTNNMPHMLKLKNPVTHANNTVTPSNTNYTKAYKVVLYKNEVNSSNELATLLMGADLSSGVATDTNSITDTDLFSDISYVTVENGDDYFGLIFNNNFDLSDALVFEFRSAFIDGTNVIDTQSTDHPFVHVQPFGNPHDISFTVLGDAANGNITVAIDMTSGTNASNYPVSSDGSELVSANNGVLDYIQLIINDGTSDISTQNHKIQSGLTTAISGADVDNNTQGQILIVTSFSNLAAGTYTVRAIPHIDITHEDYTTLTTSDSLSVDNEVNNFSKNDTVSESSVAITATEEIVAMENLQFEVDMSAGTTSVLVATNQTQTVDGASGFSHILFVSDKRMNPQITAGSFTGNDKITINNSAMSFNQNLSGTENNQDYDQEFKLYKTYGGNTDPSDVVIEDLSFVHLDLSVTLKYYTMENGHTLVKAEKSFGTNVSSNTSMTTSDVRMHLTCNSENVESSDEFFVFPGDLSGQAVTVKAKHEYGDVSNTIILAGETSAQMEGSAVPTFDSNSNPQVSNPTGLDYNLTIIDVGSGNIDVYNHDDGTTPTTSGGDTDPANVGSDNYYFIENVYGCNTNIYSS